MIPFKPDSPKCISLLLFGGKHKESVNDLIIGANGEPECFKSGIKKGQVKTKKIMKDRIHKGLIKPLPGVLPQKTGYYSTDEKHLTNILRVIEEGTVGLSESEYPDKLLVTKQIIQTLLKIREISTQNNTFFTGAKEYIDIDGIARCQYSTCITPTGRTTCKKNNHQNIPKEGNSEIKKHFVSRYKDGSIVSGDYSQLEIRIQAQLSDDPEFINDVLKGIDFHIKRAASKNDWNYEEAFKRYTDGEREVAIERTKAKQFSFARAYGAGAKKISQNTGMPLEDAQALIENEELLYPVLTSYQADLYNMVTQHGWYADPWGIRYKFEKYTDDRGKQYYNYNETLNYRNQGFATGTIVLIMLGKFWREKALHNRDKYVMINTVHDSLMLDCKPEYVDQAKEDLKLLEQVQQVSKQYFNYDFKVPITVDVNAGKTWYECK